MTESEAALVLALAEGVGPAKARRLRRAFGSYARAVRAISDGAQGTEGVPASLASAVGSVVAEGRWEKELETLDRMGARFAVEGDGDYPAVLSETAAAPIGLFVAGRRLSDLQPAIAVVGARTATPRGLATARDLAADLVRAGLAVVSGLARGADTAAHEGALSAGGGTVAVLGGGLGCVYPPENRPLARRVADGGAVVSEMASGVEPTPGLFPRRNRIISGLSAGVVVVEAGVRSGALITAARALEQGREVFAIPGPIDDPMCRGPNGLIKAGAKLVEDVGDVLDELERSWGPFGRRPSGRASQTEADGGSTLSERLLSLLSLTPLAVDDIVSRTGARVSEILAALLTLELSGHVEKTPGGRYILGARARSALRQV